MRLKPRSAATTSMLLIVESPMPRVGVLMMRPRDTESAGLATTRRYASAFLISSRSKNAVPRAMT
jgi:hypothetical protein